MGSYHLTLHDYFTRQMHSLIEYRINRHQLIFTSISSSFFFCFHLFTIIYLLSLVPIAFLLNSRNSAHGCLFVILSCVMSWYILHVDACSQKWRYGTLFWRVPRKLNSLNSYINSSALQQVECRFLFFSFYRLQLFLYLWLML